MFLDDRLNFSTEKKKLIYEKENVERSIIILCVVWITNQLLQNVNDIIVFDNNLVEFVVLSHIEPLLPLLSIDLLFSDFHTINQCHLF